MRVPFAIMHARRTLLGPLWELLEWRPQPRLHSLTKLPDRIGESDRNFCDNSWDASDAEEELDDEENCMRQGWQFWPTETHRGRQKPC